MPATIDMVRCIAPSRSNRYAQRAALAGSVLLTSAIMAGCAQARSDDLYPKAHAARARALVQITSQMMIDGFPGSEASFNNDSDGHPIYAKPRNPLAFGYDAAGQSPDFTPNEATVRLHLPNCTVDGVRASISYVPESHRVADVTQYSLNIGQGVTATFSSYNGLIKGGALGANPCATLVSATLANR